VSARTRLPRWFRWFLLSAGIVFGGAIAAAMIADATARWRLHERLLDESRTHERSLAVTSNDLLEEDGAKLLARLPPLVTLGEGGLRFAAMPSFSRRWYAVAISKRQTSGHVQLMVFDDQANGAASEPVERDFDLSAEHYAKLTAEVGELLGDWPGETHICLDGTPIAIEQNWRGRVLSGVGNASCSEHYGRVSSLIFDVVRGTLPRDSLVAPSWTPRRPIAGMKNIGGRDADSATAAHFIGRFVQPGVKWAHLDIPGMAWASRDLRPVPKDAAGYGVRLLDRYIADHYEG